LPEHPGEYTDIILMPDEFIRNRLVDNWKNIDDYDARLMPYVKDWMAISSKLTPPTILTDVQFRFSHMSFKPGAE
jgi:hypothetical protein